MSITTLLKQNKISQIDIVRTEGIVTRLHVMQALQITDLEYGQMLFDQAMGFLEDMYTDFAPEYIDKFTSSGAFWKWWKSEWLLWEQALLRAMNGQEHKLTVDEYKHHMKVTSENMMTLNGFGNFLKLCTDVTV